MNTQMSNRSRVSYHFKPTNILFKQFVNNGRNVISNHVHNGISNPMEVVNVKDGIKSVEVSYFQKPFHNQNFTFLQEYIEKCQQNLREYKKEIDLLRQEISLMDNHLSTLNDENVKLINPQLIQNFEDLHAQIVLQRKDNDHMQKQLIELKREKAQT